MIVFRLGRTKWSADLSGEGARLNGGRWNHAGIPCIYTASSRALSLVEFSAHTPLDLIARSLSFTSYKIPEDNIFICTEAILPGNWKNLLHSTECKDFGTALLRKHLIIRIPSVIIASEFNYLLSPLHPHFKKAVSISATEDYSYDIRIKI